MSYFNCAISYVPAETGERPQGTDSRVLYGGRQRHGAGCLTEQQQEEKLKKRFLSLTLALIFALSVTGCAGTAASGQGSSAPASTSAEEAPDAEPTAPAAGGEFVYGLSTEVDNFDPFVATTADAKSIYFNIYEGLVKVTPEGTFEPAVASAYEVSEDATQYTFTLRDGVKFHNGNAVTMEDVLYSVQHAIDSGITGYSNIAEFTAADDHTLVVKLTDPSTDFLANASTAIIPAGSDDNGEHALNPVGTGPFRFTEYAVQDHVTLERFDEYWGTPAYLDRVTVKFIASSSDSLMNFQSGAIDGFTANAGITEQVNKETSRLFVANSNAVQLLALNNSVAPFDDVRVRQALSYAVNSDEVIETVNYGYGVKLGSGLIPGLTAFYDESLASVYDTDVEKAKQLLTEAGYPDGFEFTIRVPSVYQVHVDTASVIVNELSQIGVTAKIELVDWATWLENVYTNRDYEATIISLDGSIASPTAFLSRYVSTAHNNFVNFASDDYDEAYAAAVAAIEETERVDAFRRCQQILNEEAASVYIQDISNILVYSDRFDGYVGYPLYAVDFSVIYQVQ